MNIQLLFFASFLSLANPDIAEIRRVYLLAITSESSNNTLSVLLEPVTSAEPLLYAYKGASLGLKAKYAYNPYSKVSYVKSGLEMINEAVQRKPADIEIRYLRLCIEINVPSFLDMSQHVAGDKLLISETLISGNHKLDPSTLKIIADFMIKNANLDAITKEKVKKATAS